MIVAVSQISSIGCICAFFHPIWRYIYFSPLGPSTGRSRGGSGERGLSVIRRNKREVRMERGQCLAFVV